MKIALVTGAYKGLGFEWCKQLGKRGYEVILTARNQEQANNAAEILNEEDLIVYPRAMDITNTESIREVVQWAKEMFGRLDVLVNNAGINSGTRAKGDKELQAKNLSLEELDPEEVLNMVRINTIAPIIVAREFSDLLSGSEQGKIIHIGSWLGSVTIKNNGGNYSYAVSKSALNMMNKALAFDLMNKNIISVVVNPGWVSTDMGGSKATFSPEESVNNLIENVLKKMTPELSGAFLNYTGEIHPL